MHEGDKMLRARTLPATCMAMCCAEVVEMSQMRQ
jgi:hypothetical protein